MQPMPPMVDDRGESDLDLFAARPSVNERIRLPFPNEFAPDEVGATRVAFVLVVTLRDPVTNEPTARGRGVFYAETDISEVPQ
jgi:hypothetical protein